jgi:hypothetical protein
LKRLREEAFYLVYFIPGMSYGDVMLMESTEREWWVKRLGEQVKREQKAVKG